MIGPLTYLDVALIAMSLISGLLAMYRGLTRELLSILSWAIAAGAVLYFVLNHKELAKEMAQQMGTQIPIAQIAVGSVIFLVVLIIVHLVTARISDMILDSQVGMIDGLLDDANSAAVHTKTAADTIRIISQDMARVVDRFEIGMAKVTTQGVRGSVELF